MLRQVDVEMDNNMDFRKSVVVLDWIIGVGYDQRRASVLTPVVLIFLLFSRGGRGGDDLRDSDAKDQESLMWSTNFLNEGYLRLWGEIQIL
jgi:hypothetical protein